MILNFLNSVVLFAFFNSVLAEFNLTVVHISDFHSHWFEFDENKHDCSKAESKDGKCYGGFPRLLTFVRDIRKKEKNVLVLSSGEFFLGRSLHALHGWKPAHSLLPRLDLDAMSLSNHDFDNGVFELSAFLYAMKFPVLCANMWARESSYLYSRVNKSVVLDVNGTKVGIVGYIHRHALKKSNNAVSVKFLPEIPALQEEVSRLESEGVDKIIALGHAGYHTDLQIAKKVKGVDIVIGGDSDIILFDPGDDTTEYSKVGNIHGNYPRVHEHETEIDNERKIENRTLVLHIPQHGMYVGVLRATFDDNGKIIHESGEPVLLNSSIPEDEDTLDFLHYARGALEDIVQHRRLPDDAEILGKTSKPLDGNRRTCRMSECSIGNFIADAILHEFTFHYRNKSEHRYSNEQWGPIDAVVFNSGPILRSIEPGFITIQDILKSVRLGGLIQRVYMSGERILEMMEHSVKHYDPSGVTAPGAFLQISGLRVEYDISQVPGRRVRRLAIRCRDCGDDDIYVPLKEYKTYVIGMPTFLRNGRDGYYDHGPEDPQDMGQFDALLIVEYLRRMYEIEPKIDGRIKFHNPNSSAGATFGLQPLLFGEPAPASNNFQNLMTTTENEDASKVSVQEKTNDINLEDTKADLKKPVFDKDNLITVEENAEASKVSVQEKTNDISLEDAKTDLKKPVSDKDAEISKIGEPEENILFYPINVSEISYKTFHRTNKENETVLQDIPENEIKSFKKRDLEKRHVKEVLQNSENIIHQSPIDHTDILSSENKDNRSNNKIQSSEDVAVNDSTIDNVLKIFLNATTNNFSSTLQNIAKFVSDSTGTFNFLDKISRFKNNLFKENFNVSLLESLEKNISFQRETLLHFKKHLQDIIDDAFRSPEYNSTLFEVLSLIKSDINLTKIKENSSNNEIPLDETNFLNAINLLKYVSNATHEDCDSDLANITKVFYKSLGVFNFTNGISYVKNISFIKKLSEGFGKNSSFSSESLMRFKKYLEDIVDGAFPSPVNSSTSFTSMSNTSNGVLSEDLKTTDFEKEPTQEARKQNTEEEGAAQKLLQTS